MMKTHSRSLVVLGVLWLLAGDVATAGDKTLPAWGVFTMLEGQGVEVCEACFKAWESTSAGPGGNGLSGCERPYDPGYGLSAPKWTELNPLKHLALLKEVMLFLMPIEKDKIPGSIYDGDNFPREIKTEMKFGRIAVSLAMVDIDNDGHTEPVFKYRHGVCGNPQAPSPSRALIVLTTDRRSIDRTKTDLVIQNELKELSRPAGYDASKIYDVFFFKEQVYFDKWDRSPDPDILTIYRATGKGVASLCKYRYELRYRSQVPGGAP